MPYQDFSDASFFSLVHHVLESAGPAENDERRDRTRHEYTVTQLIAPYRDGRLPRRTDFQPVPCHDLSPGGFSFFSAVPCPDEYLVVALGKAPYIFVAAEVVHQRPVQTDGETTLVGCRFIARIRQPSHDLLPELPRA